MRNLVVSLLVFLIGLMSHISLATAEEGPFGVSMGDDISKFSMCTKSKSSGWYTCGSLPKTHSAFESYMIKYHEKTGVCSINRDTLDALKDNRCHSSVVFATGSAVTLFASKV